MVARSIPVWWVSRRSSGPVEGWQHLGVDLLDPSSASSACAQASDTTHLVFADYLEGDGDADQIALNRRLLQNTLDGLAEVGAPPHHVTLYQGMKYYGAHLGRFKTPALEDDPRLPSVHFYYVQQDLLAQRAHRNGFRYTVLRPEGVWGYAQGTPMNLLMAIAA